MAADRSHMTKVKGLNEFQRELRKVDTELPKELRRINLDAAQLVVPGTVSRLRALGGVAARQAPTVRAAAEQRRAKVDVGGSNHPEVFGAIFGGKGRPTTQQFRPHRGGEGYGLYPEIRAREDDIEELYERSLDQLMRRAFPD